MLPKGILWKVDQKIVSGVLLAIEANIVATERIISLTLEAPVKIPLVLKELEEFYASCGLQRSSLQKFIKSVRVGENVELAERRMLIVEFKKTLLRNRKSFRPIVEYAVSRATIAASVKLIVKSSVEESKYDHMEHYSSNVDCLGRLLRWDLDEIEGDGDDPWEFWKFWK